VTPPGPATAPSDAIVLFNGHDLSQWTRTGRGTNALPSTTPLWKIENGYMEVTPEGGGIVSKEKFADCQIHLEWATPSVVTGKSQGRGNSGVILSGHPEIQVLDSFENDTYPDGQASALYGQYPPLVNASRKPGEWQTYDIIYYAPRLDATGKITKPATYTVLHNGLLVHHAVEVPGATVESTLSLQNHNNPVRYRNIWVRRLRGYDDPGKPL
jgi:hypothetical protein